MKSAALAVAAALAATLVSMQTAGADSATVDITGTTYQCKGTTLTVTSGSLSLATVVSYPTATSVRVQEVWSIASPVSLRDAGGNTYSLVNAGGGTTGDVTITNGGLPVGTATENWSYNYVTGGNGRFGNQRLTRTYYADGTSSVSVSGNCGDPTSTSSSTGTLTTARQVAVASR